MRGHACAVAAGAAAALALPAAAPPHVVLSPTIVRPGSERALVLTVFSDRSDAVVTRVEAEAPAEAQILDARGPSGWRQSLERGSIVWDEGRILPLQTARFVMRVAAPRRRGGIFPFVEHQTYDDGRTDSFRVVLITQGAPVPPRGRGGGVSVALVAGLAAGGLALAAAGALLLVRYRRRT